MGQQRVRSQEGGRWAVCRSVSGAIKIVDTTAHRLDPRTTVLERAPSAVAARRAARRLDRPQA